MWLVPWLWPFLLSPPTIRPATRSDCARMADIHAQGFAQGWHAADFEQMLDERHGADVLVSKAPIGEVVTGFALSRIAGDEAELLSIALDREVRAKGYSARLLDAHCAGLRRMGVETLFLEVADDNASALALYRRLGFVEIGRRKGYYRRSDPAKRSDALTMKRSLEGFDPTPRRLF